MEARLVLVLALCVLPAIVTGSRPLSTPFLVQGRVFCDPCRVGFETSATTFIAGAKVRIECVDRDSMKLVYSKEGITDSKGRYEISVPEDHENQMCDCMLVSSPQRGCSSLAPGRDRAPVMLTRNNGIVSYTRFANSMGFMMTEAMSGCTQVLQQYQEDQE